jgi:hypothetical protein
VARRLTILARSKPGRNAAINLPGSITGFMRWQLTIWYEPGACGDQPRRQAASVIGWIQGDEIMYGREFALHLLQHRLAAPRPGDAIVAVARFTAYAACPASGYQETHSPGGRGSAPGPTPVALRICANGITPDGWARLRRPRVLCRRPLSAPRRTQALAALCDQLTAADARYPGTDLVLRYEVKSRPSPA